MWRGGVFDWAGVVGVRHCRSLGFCGTGDFTSHSDVSPARTDAT